MLVYTGALLFKKVIIFQMKTKVSLINTLLVGGLILTSTLVIVLNIIINL